MAAPFVMSIFSANASTIFCSCGLRITSVSRMASATCSRMADPAGAPSGVFDAASGTACGASRAASGAFDAASGAACGTSRAASGAFDAAAISSSAVIAAGAAAARLPFCPAAALCSASAERLPSESPNVSSICRGSCPSRLSAPLLLFSSVILRSSRSRSLWSCFLILSGSPVLSCCFPHTFTLSQASSFFPDSACPCAIFAIPPASAA